jgi:PAS domain S-box-containing protein
LRRSSLPYLVAILAIAAALLVRWALDPWLGPRVPYITIFGAVIVAAWFGGAAPALLAAVLGWAGTDLLFVEPRGTFHWRGIEQALEIFAYALSAALIAALGGAMHRARRRTHESEERFRAFMQNSPSGVFLKDEAGRYVFMNRTAERLTGTENWAGRTDDDILDAPTARQVRVNDRTVLDEDRGKSFVLSMPTPEGERTLHSVKFPLRDGLNRRYVGSITTDITEQRLADQAVRDARQRLQTVADAMPAVVTLCSRDLRYLWINQRGAQWLRRPAGEVIGRTMGEVIGEAQLAQIRPYVDRVLAGEYVDYEREVEYPAVGKRWASVRFAPAPGNTWVAVITDIDERKRMEQELQEADRRKDQFIATLAHELRNPLAPIRTAVAILGRADAAAPDRDWAVGVIERQVGHMARLVDDLLDVARISSGKLLLRREHVAAGAVVAAAIETSRPVLDAAGHRLATRMPGESAVLHADATRVAQVLSNLLNNAAKYTPRGGSIELRAEVAGGEAVFSVLDNGIGFPPERARQIFEPFAQWAPAEQAAAGLGIGLSLVQGIVELHGGTVSAASDGPGKGSRFEVRLPLAAATNPALPRSRAADASAPLGVRVLIADDNRDAADTMCRVLALYGYEVRSAYDGGSAIELCETFQPHVAVLDIGMPLKSGYEVARELRARHGKRIRLVALTGWGTEADVQRARDAGFDHHLTKPVDPNELNRVLSGVSLG